MTTNGKSNEACRQTRSPSSGQRKVRTPGNAADCLRAGDRGGKKQAVLAAFNGTCPRKRLNRVGGPARVCLEEVTTLHERLAAYRHAMGLTQAKVAERTFIQLGTDSVSRPLKRATLAMYEIGAAEPTLAVIEQLARIYGCSPGRLAFGIGRKRL